MFTSWSPSMTFFFVWNLFMVRFAAIWKVRIWGTLYKEDVKSKGVYKFHFLFESYLATQIWDSCQWLQHWRKKDYKISLIYCIVTKISKSMLKIQIHQQIVVAQEFTFTACFQKGKKLKIFSRRFNSLSFPNFSLSLI